MMPTSIRTTVAPFLLLLLLCFLCLFTTTKCSDLEILLNLKTSLQNTKTSVFTTWVSANSPCNFHGITCDSQNSVSEIDLSNQSLTGAIPFDSICKLPALQNLSLRFNSFSGEIADSIKNCTRLQYLDLGSNCFTGSFPDVSGMSEMRYLYMNHSGFSGDFPWKSLRNMTGLIALSLGDNPFLPTQFPAEILELKSLEWLYLSNMNLEGTIPPGIGDLSGLINLELSQNNLTGEIPEDIGKLKNLWQLELYKNNLTGKIPSGFRNLTKLENFDASDNNLEGDLSELRFLTNLVTLQLYKNKLSGEVPVEFGRFMKLVNLSLYTNELTGTLPPELGSWSDFDFIDLSENYLTGQIPPDMCKRGTMRGLLLLQNNLTGEIPSTYATCTSLLRLRVSKNSLSGEVPAGIWGLPQVNIIDLEFNQFEGPVTSDIGDANGLGQLLLGSNRFSGEIPEEISGADSLVSVNLNDNQFSGKIPESIGALKQLSSLHLQNNMFSGSMPESLGSCDSLSDLNIAHNSLTGQIPSSLGSLPVLNSLNLSDNGLSGQIPDSLSSLRLSLLDLSKNRLVGPLPLSLSIEAYNGSFANNPGLCSQTVTSFNQCIPEIAYSKVIRTVIACLTVGLFVLFALFAYYFYKKNREKYHHRSLKDESWNVKSFEILSFSEDEIIDSIKEENLVGKGGSGNVYKVTLKDGKSLAVKHIWTNTDLDNLKWSKGTSPMLAKRGSKSKEFDAEVRTLSSIRHVNVIKLFCSITSDDSSLLVYEYLPNGSLWDRLHSSKKVELDWEARYDIALGAAKGLEYLHHGCQRPVIHRDVKSSNILLDEFLKPRIADFGLAKIVQASTGKDSMHVIAGTHGYIAPEYAYTCKVNEKSDVYSFGVVLMELVSGKRPIEPEFGENKDIVDWVSSNLKTRDTALGIIDSRIPDPCKDDAMKVLRIAILCTARLPALRPTMRSVVQMLEQAGLCRLVGIVIRKDGSTRKMQVIDKDKSSSDS